MKLYFKYPSVETLDLLLKKQTQAGFNYTEQRGTLSGEVEGYDNDNHSVLLGQGDAVWENAKEALNQWKQFPALWTKIYKSNTPLKKGNTVMVIFRLFRLWWTSSARIVYDFDEQNRYGFAYGTLKGHVEQGEECFWIERDEANNIYYRIKVFSTPAFWGARLTYPLPRTYQRKFVKDSQARMKALANS